MRKLQFETDDSTLGLTKATGFIWPDEKGVHIEYQVSDNIIEIYKSAINELFVSYDQIDDIIHKKSWFSGGKVYVHLSSLKNIGRIPFLQGTAFCLSIKRNQKEQIKDFVVNTKFELSNYRLSQLEKI